MKLTEVPWTIMEYLRLITVEPIMFALSMTTFMQQPSNQLLVLQKVCLLNYNFTICNDDISETIAMENNVHADAAFWNFYLKMALLIPSALVSSVYGSLSDTVGRRVFLIIPSVGIIFGAVSFILQASYPHQPLWYLIISEAIVGLSGNVLIGYIVTKSYMCDITDTSNRTKRLGAMKSISYLGGPIGAFLSGILIDKNGFDAVYSIIITIHVMVVIYVLLLLEETVICNVDDDDDEEETTEGKGKKEYCEDDSEESTCGPYCITRSRLCSKVLTSIEQMLLVCFRERLGFRRKHLLLTQIIGIIHNICTSGQFD